MLIIKNRTNWIVDTVKTGYSLQRWIENRWVYAGHFGSFIEAQKFIEANSNGGLK